MSDDMMSEGDLIEVKLEIRLPKAATAEQVEDWLYFNLLQVGSMSDRNPLCNDFPEDFGPNSLSWEWTGYQGRKEEYGHEPTENGGTKYKVRYIRERAA